MPGFTTALPPERIGKIKGEILAHAVATEVLGITGMQRQLPKNNGQTVVYRRYLPFGAANTNWNTRNRPVVNAVAHELTEGVTAQECTIKLTVQRLPLRPMRDGNDKPEIRQELHPALVNWMLYRVYGRTDSDIFDPSKAAVALANFESEFGRKASGRNEEWVRSGHVSIPGPIA